MVGSALSDLSDLSTLRLCLVAEAKLRAAMKLETSKQRLGV